MNTVLNYDDCVLVVNASKLEYLGVLDDWKNKNKELIIEVDLPPSTCTHKKLVVGLNVFTNIEDQFKWLKENSDYFCYAESYPFIEKSHIVDQNNSTIDDLVIAEINANRSMSMTLKDIINKNIEFDTVFYNKLIGFRFDSNRNLDIQLLNDYNSTFVCYSIPFFKSIIEVNEIKFPEQCIFEFAEIKYDDGINTIKTIAFKLSYLGKSIADTYYDYSTRPGVAFIPILL